MLNIVFLSPHSDPEAKTGEKDSGGQCIYEYELAKHLGSEGHASVTVYCRKNPHHPDVTIVNDHFKIKRITCGGEHFIPKEQLEPYLYEFAEKVVLDLSQSGITPDVIHGHYWDGGMAMLLVSKKLNNDVPLVWTPHSLGNAKRKDFRGAENEIKYRFTSRIMWETFAMLAANTVIVSTEDEKEKIVEHYGIPEDKIKIISPGIGLSNFRKTTKEQSRQKLKLPLDIPIVMTLGRLDKRKGYHNAIHAFAEFTKLRKTNAILAIFAGKHEKLADDEQQYLTELKELAQELGIQDKVIFRDAIDYKYVRYVYAASDVYLCLSEYEPFGLSILESMYMNVPVISTSNGGPVNIITENYNGLLVDAHDYKKTALALYRMLYSSYTRNYIISNAKGYIRHKYTWSSRARDFIANYERLKNLPANDNRKKFITHVVATNKTKTQFLLPTPVSNRGMSIP